MPVYNSEKYLAKAIESILRQSYSNFEFIIVNDGSTDGSLDIIKRYVKKDSRIIIVNQKNKGIVESLNTAIELSKGKYIARMDSDDISLKGRLKSQIDYLEKNNKIGLVATRVQMIDQDGKSLDYFWPEDYRAQTVDEIKAIMPKTNCIAHPSIMAKSELFKKYIYLNQKNGEDYDLWLRMLSDGILIAKINKGLLKYRIHKESITSKSNSDNSLRKIINLKKGFLSYQIKSGKWSSFESKVSKTLMDDLLEYYSSSDKKAITRLLGKSARKTKKILGYSIKIPAYYKENRHINKLIKINNNKQNNNKKILFILPWMTTGGADKVAFDIANQLKSKYDWHFIITEKGQPNNWISLFERITGNIIDISNISFSRNKSIFIRDYCKKNNIEEILISNSISGYRSLPFVKINARKIKVIDILHGEGGKLEGGGYPSIMQPFEKYIDIHITVTEYLKKILFRKYGNNPEKISVIHNGIDTSDFKLNKKAKSKNIAWVGRMSPEKHPEITLAIAEAMPEYEFKIIGGGQMLEDVRAMAKDAGLKNINIVGEKNDIDKELSEVSMLIMTSEIEGLPIVLLEAGAKGIPVVAPKVGGIPEYVVSGKNGYMVNRYDSIEEYMMAINKINGGRIWQGSKIKEHTGQKFGLKQAVKKYEKAL